MGKKVYIAWAFLVVSIVGLLVFIGFETDKQISDYVHLESELEEAASIYIIKENVDIPSGGEAKINIKDLKKKGYVESISVGDDTCSGSVIVTKKTSKNIYKAQIKCKKYKSLKK